MRGQAESAPLPGSSPTRRPASALLFDAVNEVRATRLAHLGPHGPVVAQAVAQFQDVQVLGEAYTIADVEARREIAAEHDRGVVGEQIGFDADLLDAHVLAYFLRQ